MVEKQTGGVGQPSRMHKWAGRTWLAGDSRRDGEIGCEWGVWRINEHVDQWHVEGGHRWHCDEGGHG